MVEKWLQSKANPYISTRKPVQRKVIRTGYVNQVSNPFVQARRPMPQQRARPSSFSKHVAARFGTPIQLFKDSDKDGVMNVFDCKPYNKRKQDVMHPQNFGSGVGDMYARQEGARQQKEYQKMLKELQRQEEQRLAELQRIQTPIYNYETVEYTGPNSFNLTDAQIKKIMEGNSSGGSGGGSTTKTTTTSSGSNTPNKYISQKPMLQQSGPTITYTGKQAQNIMATGDPNKSGKTSILSKIGTAISNTYTKVDSKVGGILPGGAPKTSGKTSTSTNSSSSSNSSGKK